MPKIILRNFKNSEPVIELGARTPRIAGQWIKRWDAIWRTSTTGLWTKTFFASVYSLNINTQCCQVMQVLTGQGKLNSYLFKLKKIERPICMCATAEETTEHLLFYCSSFNNERLIFTNNVCKSFSQWPPALHSLIWNKHAWSLCIDFILKTKHLCLITH